MTLARDQHLAEEQRRRFEERTKAAKERAKAREVEEIENMADPGAGPHIETKKTEMRRVQVHHTRDPDDGERGVVES